MAEEKSNQAGKSAGEGDGVKNVVDKQPKTSENGTRVVRTEGRDFRVEGNVVDGYIGVDPEYRTYAQQTDKPLLSEEDVEFLERTGTMTDVERLTMQNASGAASAFESEASESEVSDEGKSDALKSSTVKAPAPTKSATTSTAANK